MSKYSIILPVRNGGDYVKQCVNSILQQTLKDFSFIILDNCSTDGTLEWLSTIDDKRIVIYPSEKSLSIEENWARIRDVPKDEFMTMIGHDDLLEPHYLEEMNALISRHPSASLFQSHFDYIDKDGSVTRHCLPMDEVQSAHEFLACQMNGTIDSTGTGYMMRSRDFEDLGGMPVNYPNLIFADYELWINLQSKAYKATSLKRCFFYREHLSVSRVTNGMVYQAAFQKYVQFVAVLKFENGYFSEVISRYGKKLLLSYCESLSHRLLKTPLSNRSLKTGDLVAKFYSYAELLIPGQSFEPHKISRIRWAIVIDKFWVFRTMFILYKQILRF